MAKRDFLQRHLLIISLLRKRACSFEEIQNYLSINEDESGYQLNISQRTFQRDRDEIYSIWGIEITFDRKKGVYQIINEENSEDEIIQRTLESYDLISALKQNRKVGKYIFLENRKSSGTEFFNAIIKAIEDKVIITFEHLSFTKEPRIRRCVPKGIKETQNRFYLIAYDLEAKDFRNFGMDRMTNLNLTKETSTTPELNIEAFYHHAFGIERTYEAQKIVLKFKMEQMAYVQSLPFHHSQEIVEETETYFIVELFMHPTHDFLLEIMKHGPICEVLEPKILRDQVMERVGRLAKMYFN